MTASFSDNEKNDDRQNHRRYADIYAAINPVCKASLPNIGTTTTSAYSWLCRRRHNHELSHALVRLTRTECDQALDYAQEELVVESVAFCSCQTVGLDTSANSIPYLASWAQSASLEVLEQTAALTSRLADRIEHALLDTDEHPDPVDTKPASTSSSPRTARSWRPDRLTSTPTGDRS